ncbi:flagellar basal body P-ring formation chaperone FlgA [Shimia aestuarii]|uniref:Flagella basal body P-ring formation protein FlgA n=1 Tax=Shimia aestuarii TaxID=254406 RepID=A0A1I4K9H8_9RHOB|nr:flagellar basal body P-ring formation chaperone FlgA [Shimia aestuarii]SFL75289.1 flagella basal body P-ring formation protein FlgA [Shimia aestuarii]
MRFLCMTLALLLAQMAQADMVVATQTIRATSIIPAKAVALRDGTTPGVHSNLSEVIGFEARTTIYAGRPVRLADVGTPALIERNQIVVVTFVTHGLTIRAEGRSLSRAGVGERARVMNLSSRNTVSGTVMPDGSVSVSN